MREAAAEELRAALVHLARDGTCPADHERLLKEKVQGVEIQQASTRLNTYFHILLN